MLSGRHHEYSLVGIRCLARLISVVVGFVSTMGGTARPTVAASQPSMSRSRCHGDLMRHRGGGLALVTPRG